MGVASVFMPRPYSITATLVTHGAEGSDEWDVVDGVRLAFSPDTVLPFALSKDRSYRITFDDATEEWTLESRSGR